MKPQNLIKRILFFFVIFVVPFTIDLKLLPIYMYQHLVFTISVYYKPFYSVVSFHTCCTKQIYNQLQKYLRQCTLFWLNGLSMILCLSYPSSPLMKIASSKRSWSLVWLAAIWNKKGRFFIGVSQHFCNWLKLAYTACTNITTKICTCDAYIIVNESLFKL